MTFDEIETAVYLLRCNYYPAVFGDTKVLTIENGNIVLDNGFTFKIAEIIAWRDAGGETLRDELNYRGRR